MLNLNQATVEELQKIKGIGQVTAEKIVEYRTTQGGFSSLEELTNVSGIGQKSVEQMKDKLSVEEGAQEVDQVPEAEQAPTADDKVEITFNPQDYGLGELGEVHLVGEMNGWDPADKSYALRKEDGIWKNKFDLEAGMEYKIMYDAISWEAGQDIGDLNGSNFEV